MSLVIRRVERIAMKRGRDHHYRMNIKREFEKKWKDEKSTPKKLLKPIRQSITCFFCFLRLHSSRYWYGQYFHWKNIR
ncbi:hypothetical protein GCK32_015736 [Trichostrongylus colubriformis]|uniref:Uncharacterized protein n=1 Tax=Trichostrongylus colubriformis TaxID=6319 RepID=A0AAN8EWP2_TRICO